MVVVPGIANQEGAALPMPGRLGQGRHWRGYPRHAHRVSSEVLATPNGVLKPSSWSS